MLYGSWSAQHFLLDVTQRGRLQLAACEQPLALHEYYKMYPQRINEKALNAALVQAVLMKFATAGRVD